MLSAARALVRYLAAATGLARLIAGPGLNIHE